jgi:hypothetical protein
LRSWLLCDRLGEFKRVDKEFVLDLSLGILIQAVTSSDSVRTDHIFINPVINELCTYIEARSAFQITFIKDISHQFKDLVANLFNRPEKIIKVYHTVISQWLSFNKRLIEHHNVIC